jgi:UDP-glucose 4-epimerase
MGSTQSNLPIYRLINGGSGRGVSVGEVLNLVTQQFGTKDKIKFSGLVRPGDPIGLEADITEIKALGWSPCINLSSGIERYVEWYKNFFYD